MTGSIEFLWTHDNPEGLTYRLYEDGTLAVDDIGEMKFTLLMEGKPYKAYGYHVTAYDSRTKLESEASNVVTVNFTIPAAPTDLRASWLR